MMSDQLLELLAEVSTTFQSCLSDLPASADTGLSPFEVRLLTLIGRFPGTTQHDFGVMLARDKGQIARTVKKLEEHGLVRREASPTDWRSQHLLLSQQGAEISNRVLRGREELGSYVLQDLSLEDREATTVVLGRLLSRLREI